MENERKVKLGNSRQQKDSHRDSLVAENERLKKELQEKENELQRSKLLNHELSI